MDCQCFEPDSLIFSKFRSKIPKQLSDAIITFLTDKYFGPLNLCLDVGCGNGESTWVFSPYFNSVIGTDINEAHIEEAMFSNCSKRSNVEFKTGRAEQLHATSGSVQLVTSNQACHAFQLRSFLSEADRVLCPGGVLALSGYSIVPHLIHPEKADELAAVLEEFHHERLNGYWKKNKELVISEYLDIPIPYSHFSRKEIWSDEIRTTLESFVKNWSTLSAYQTYCKENGQEAGQLLLDEMIESIQKVLDNFKDPAEIQLKMKLKYFLILGRKK